MRGNRGADVDKIAGGPVQQLRDIGIGLDASTLPGQPAGCAEIAIGDGHDMPLRFPGRMGMPLAHEAGADNPDPERSCL